MRPKLRTADAVIAELGSSAHGVVTRRQLLAEGISEGEIKRRLRAGTLLPQFRGVYRVGHQAPNLEASYMAAVLACGEGALIYGRAATHLWAILKGPAPPPEVLAPTERRVPGLVVHRSRALRPEHGTLRRGIPLTTVARTIVDMAPRLSLDALARLCHEAGVLHRTTPRQVKAVLAGWPSAPGAAKLRLIFEGDVPVTLSALERRFIELVREAELPLPVTNRVAGGRRVDCRWPEHRLTVELDSYTYHHSRYAWEQGNLRALEARVRGDEFRRYTYGDVFDRPALVQQELRELLGPKLRPRPAPRP